jgi:hypothetical protein
MAKDNIIDLDEFTLGPSTGLSNQFQKADPGDADNPKDAIDEDENEDNDDKEKSKEKKTTDSKKDDSKKAKKEEDKDDEDEDDEEDSKKDKKKVTSKSKEDVDADDEVEEENDDDDDDKDPEDFSLLAKEVYDELGFDTEFSSKEFKKEFGTGVKAITKFISTVIAENARPQFDNEEAKKFYEYITEGGDPKDLKYLIDTSIKYEEIKEDDLEENEDLQKSILKSYLKELNPKKDTKWIDSKIQKYIDGGLAVDEAKEALEEMKTISKEKIDAELKAKKDAKKAEDIKQAKYWEDIETKINQSEEIAGNKLTREAKNKFFKYLSSGQYQSDLKKNSKAELELAFVMFQGGLDKIVKKTGETKAVGKLEAKLGRFTSNGAKIKGKVSPKTREENNTNLDDWSL